MHTTIIQLAFIPVGSPPGMKHGKKCTKYFSNARLATIAAKVVVVVMYTLVLLTSACALLIDGTLLVPGPRSTAPLPTRDFSASLHSTPLYAPPLNASHASAAQLQPRRHTVQLARSIRHALSQLFKLERLCSGWQVAQKLHCRGLPWCYGS
jgi:hypothetical protein